MTFKLDGKMEITTLINGKETKVKVREFLGMYQIISGDYSCGIIRKEDVI